MDEIIITEEEAVQPRKRARWYLLHTYSGFEQRVEKTIKEIIRRGEDNGLIHDCLVPVERVIELNKNTGNKRTATRKLYPGYVMVKMEMEPHSWNLVQNIPKVTGFIGAKNDPTPIKDDEVEAILSRVEEGKETPRPKFNFELGEEVHIIDGPFASFNGVVDEVNYEKNKLRVSVSFFGRQTPVELDFVQVSKE